jgi:hypothetical protein
MIIPNPSPKVRFNESEVTIKEHHRILEHPSFQKSCDAAMLQLQVELMGQIPKEQAGNFNAAAAAHLRLQGAHEFLTVFRKLTDTGDRPVRRDDINLDHKA